MEGETRLHISNLKTRMKLLRNITSNACMCMLLGVYDNPLRSLGPLLLASVSKYIHYNVWDEIIYPLANSNDTTVGVYE